MTAAEAMAVVCKQFVLGGNIKLVHVQELVARLVDGFGIAEDASFDIHECGFAFAGVFDSGMYRVRDVAGAFVAGM
jgi:hypothetical protein